MSKHTIEQEFKLIFGFIATIWAIYFLGWFVPSSFLNWGLVPRSLSGAVGVITMPLLHGSFGHLLGNTIPLFVLLALMAGSRANSLATVIAIWLLGGVLLWLFGRSDTLHVGASGLIYGLSTFLICAGFLEKRLLAIIIAIGVFFIYGTSLLWGLIPSFTNNVSWDGHLFGGIAGAIVAFAESKSLAQDRDTQRMSHIE